MISPKRTVKEKRVLELTGSEDLAAAITAGGKLGVIAIATVDLVCLGPELFVHERYTTLVAQETNLVPVLVFVGKILKQQISCLEVRPDKLACKPRLCSAISSEFQ